jgi:hypothetical protein
MIPLAWHLLMQMVISCTNTRQKRQLYQSMESAAIQKYQTGRQNTLAHICVGNIGYRFNYSTDSEAVVHQVPVNLQQSGNLDAWL